jgi:hypothetical protein
MELGTVVANPFGPSTQKFNFVLAKNGSRVRRGQFVQVHSEEGTLVAVVSELYKANRYFERAESISEYEKSGGAGFLENFPAGEWEYVVADCAILGSFDSVLKRNSFPPSPGAKVQEIDLSMLKSFLGFEEVGLNLGKLLQHELPAEVSTTRLLQKHLAILGISGSGKSVSASVVVEELLSIPRGMGRMAVVALDSHGDYLGFKERESPFKEKTQVIDGNKVRIACRKASAQFFRELVPEMSSTQGREFVRVFESLKKEARQEQKAFDLNQVVFRIEGDEGIKENIKSPLLAWLGELNKMNLFGMVDAPDLKDLVKPGRLAVVDLSGINSLRKKQVIASYFATRLFSLRQKEKIPPFLLLVEEAHNFAREKAPKGSAIAKPAIEKIAREGRKFGACLCLVSQRPIQLSTTALSQCNSFLIMRITNPYDLDHIGKSCEAIDSATLGAITTLRVGEGILLGEAVNHPIFLRVRNRITPRSLKGIPLEEMAKRFEENSVAREVEESDIEAFL